MERGIPIVTSQFHVRTLGDEVTRQVDVGVRDWVCARHDMKERQAGRASSVYIVPL